MPMFHLKVNVPGGSHHGVVKDADAFVKQLSKLLAETSTKPESICQVTVEWDVTMTFAGTTDPTAYAEYICIGVIGGNYNAEITAKFSALLEKELGISKNRFYIKFVNPKAADIGTHGSNCAIVYNI